MALSDTLPTQDAGGLSIADERLINAGEYVTSTAGVPRLGILPAHTNPIITGLASMGYSVAAFVGVVSRTGGITAEKIANNGATTVTTTAAPASNSRIDVIWVRPQFVASADSGNVPLFGVTQGTAAASPSKPSIPAGALELATAVIPSTATTTTSSGVVITQTFLYTAFEGGTVLLRNQAEENAWAPHDGSLAFRLDTQTLRRRGNGSWNDATSFTPTWTGVTLGSSTQSGIWWRDGDWIEGEVHLKLASGWNFDAPVRLVPPVTIVTPADSPIGEGIFVDDGTGYYPGNLVRSGDNIAPLFHDTTTGRLSNVVNTGPFPWTVNDAMHLHFRYRG